MMIPIRRVALSAALVGLAITSASAQGVCDGVSPVSNTGLQSVEIVTGVSAPLGAWSPPGDTERLFIIEQGGEIKLHKRGDPPGTTTTFLTIPGVKSGGEQGLLGLAFSPDYATSGHFYVNYSVGSQFCGIFGGPCEQVVSRWTRSAGNPDVADALSEVEIMRFDEPQTNHNGGQLEFGPDGFLYVYTGDGGGANDNHGTCGNSQNLGNLLGKILRIDVNGVDPMGTAPDTGCDAGYTLGTGFTVPSTNPLKDGAGGNCDEIWAYGLRNPWRNSFDALTGDLYVADVGQNCYEEVNYLDAASLGTGENYGWRLKEGLHCFDPAQSSNCNVAPPGPTCNGQNCSTPGLIDPVVEYTNPAEGDSVIGGYVYRGCRMAGFQGTYFYGDNGSGFIRSFEISGGVPTNQQTWSTALGGPFANTLTSFGVDAQGEVLIADAGAGAIRKIMPPFPDFEVSGLGAQPFRLHRTAAWSWEDLQFTSMHPVDYYQVWRSASASGTFTCIHSTFDTTWAAGGDATTPAPGAVNFYLVTAVNGTQETSSGNPPRTLGTACSPP